MTNDQNKNRKAQPNNQKAPGQGAQPQQAKPQQAKPEMAKPQQAKPQGKQADEDVALPPPGTGAAKQTAAGPGEKPNPNIVRPDGEVTVGTDPEHDEDQDDEGADKDKDDAGDQGKSNKPGAPRAPHAR